MAIKANTTGTDQEDSSAGAQIRQYLASQGLDYNAANVKAALSRNARTSDQAGADPIEGLRNYGVDDPGVGQRGNAARKVEGGPRGQYASPTPERPSGPPNTERPSGGGNQVTSAQPVGSNDGSILPALATAILGGGALLGADAYGRRGGGGVSGPEVIPPDVTEPMGRGAMPSTGRVMDVSPTAIAGPQGAALPAPDPMTAALDRATATPQLAAPAQALPAPAPAPQGQIPGPQVTPDMVAGGGGLPPGVSPVDAANVQLRANPTGALPAAGRGAVTGGMPMRGVSPTQSIIDALIEAAKASPRLVRK
jgi:hypothetical protein